MSLSAWVRRVEKYGVPRAVAVVAYGRCRLAQRLPPARRPAAMREIVRALVRAGRPS